MKRLGIVLALSVLLCACGGGSSDSSPSPTPTPAPPPPPPNTAPTLTGSLLLSVPANLSGSLVLDVTDAEGDTITASSSDADWLSFDISGGQLTVTASPTVFELGENLVDVVLSDGTDSNTYALTINVDDNPSSYTYMDVDADAIAGGWQLSNGQTLFFDEFRGFWATSSTEFVPFERTILESTVELRLYPFGCMSCPVEEVRELRLVDEHNDGRLAFRVEGSEILDSTVIASRIEDNQLDPAAYTEATLTSGRAFRADLATPEVEIAFDTFVSIGNSSYSSLRDFKLSAQVMADGKISVSNNTEILANQTITQTLAVIDNAGFEIGSESLEFGVQLSELNITSTPIGLTVFTGSVNLTLLDESNLTYPISRYIGLQEALDNNSRRVMNVYSELTAKDFPAFSVGDSYLLRIAHQIASADDSETYGKVTFTSDVNAHVEMAIIDPINPSQRALEATYVVDGSNLNLTVEDKTYEFSLFTNSHGRDVTVSTYEANEQALTLSYIFAKKESFTLDPDSLLGFWRSIIFLDAFSSSADYTSFSVGGRMDRVFTFNGSIRENDFYRVNDDDTISVLRNFHCSFATSFSECEQAVIDSVLFDPSSLIFLEQFEVFSISEQESILTRTIWYDAPEFEQPLVGTFARIFIKVDESHFD